jgi:hypothetical protein
MQLKYCAEVDLGQHVTIEDDHGLGEVVAGIPNRAGGPKRRRFDDIPDRNACVRTVAEDLFNAARLIVQAEDDLVNLRHLLQQIDLIVQKRPTEDRNDWFRRVDGEGTQSRALPSGEKDRLHDKPRFYCKITTSPES